MRYVTILLALLRCPTLGGALKLDMDITNICQNIQMKSTTAAGQGVSETSWCVHCCKVQMYPTQYGLVDQMVS